MKNFFVANLLHKFLNYTKPSISPHQACTILLFLKTHGLFVNFIDLVEVSCNLFLLKAYKINTPYTRMHVLLPSSV